MTTYKTFIIDDDGEMLEMTAAGEMKTVDSTLLGAKDPLNDGICTIEVEHYEIHEGEHFFIQNYIEVANAGVLNHTFLTGAKYVHMTFEVSAADAGFILQTYEGATGDNDGTLLTPLNNQRPSATTSTMTVRQNPSNTAVVGATLLRAGRFGTGGAVAQRTAGNVQRANEIIFKPNTKYLLRITNLSTSANNINYSYNWYEQ
jgi:hypothetical protein